MTAPNLDLFSLLDEGPDASKTASVPSGGLAAVGGGGRASQAVVGGDSVDAPRARPITPPSQKGAVSPPAGATRSAAEPKSQGAGLPNTGPVDTARGPVDASAGDVGAPSMLSAECFDGACAEVGSMLVTQLASLPLGTTVRCALPAGGTGLSPVPPVAFVVTYCRAAYTAAREAKVLVLKGGELAALAIAAASGRATEVELRNWLARKRADASWDLTPQFAVAGIASASIVRGKDGFGDGRVADVLHAYGARVVAVGVGDAEGVALVAEIASAAAEAAKKKGRAA